MCDDLFFFEFMRHVAVITPRANIVELCCVLVTLPRLLLYHIMIQTPYGWWCVVLFLTWPHAAFAYLPHCLVATFVATCVPPTCLTTPRATLPAIAIPLRRTHYTPVPFPPPACHCMPAASGGGWQPAYPPPPPGRQMDRGRVGVSCASGKTDCGWSTFFFLSTSRSMFSLRRRIERLSNSHTPPPPVYASSFFSVL